MATILLLLVLQTQLTGSQSSQGIGSIAGVVLDTAGRPLAGAVVSIAAASRSVRTDSLGWYRLDKVPATGVGIVAWAYGHKTVMRDTVVRRGEVIHVDFVLHLLANGGLIPAGAIIGVVRDTAGRPVSTASVVLTGLSLGTMTDSLGRYHFDSVPVGPMHLWVRHIGYRGVKVDTTVAAGQPLWIDFVLREETFRLAPLAITSRLHLE